MEKFIPNSYGYWVPKREYEELQIEVDKMNDIRMKGLMEFNSFLESIGIDKIALDGNKPAKELTKTNAKGYVYDVRIKRFPEPYKNPYDMDYKDQNPEVCKKLMIQKIQNFKQINAAKQFENIAVKTKTKFENKLSYMVSQSENPIRFKLLNKIMNMSVEEFTKIHFNWYNNIAGSEVFHINYVINQWASYFGVDTEIEYDSMTGEDREKMYKNMPKISFGKEDDLDKEIRHYFYDFGEG
jgi:hypothetical protein